jgi:hypothetical protein
MFFKKNRVKVPDYLEERVKEILIDNGAFRIEGFFDEYHTLLSNMAPSQHVSPMTAGGLAVTQVDRDLFNNRFIGTMLWLIKYRTLTSAKNSPRKLAFLDLKFDIEMPAIIDSCLQHYDTDTIKESYDSLDIRCKKVFTGELQKDDEPRFLISPLWAKNPDPHPFHIAAQIFVEDMGHDAVLGNGETGNGDVLTDLIERRFMELTQPVADVSADVNFVWMANR